MVGETESRELIQDCQSLSARRVAAMFEEQKAWRLEVSYCTCSVYIGPAGSVSFQHNQIQSTAVNKKKSDNQSLTGAVNNLEGSAGRKGKGPFHFFKASSQIVSASPMRCLFCPR